MKFFLLALLPLLLQAQQKQPVSSMQEDCGVTFRFNTQSSGAQAPVNDTGTTPVIDNRQAGCIDWLVTYEPTTAVVALSLAFQTATDVAGVPTTWSNYPGTLTSGINPNTAATTGGAVTLATGTAYPFLRMNLTSLTGGVVSGKLYGWKRRPTFVTVTSGGGCPGTVGTPCVVVGPTAAGSPPTTAPVLVAGQDGTNIQTIKTDQFGGVVPSTTNVTVADGRGSTIRSQANAQGNPFTYIVYPFAFNGASGFWDQQFVCPSQALVTLTDATRTVLVAASGSTNIRICELDFTTAGAPEEFTISTGTGSACGTGTAVISDWLNVVAVTKDYQPTAALRGGASNAVCVTQSGGAQTAKVVAIYAQF